MEARGRGSQRLLAIFNVKTTRGRGPHATVSDRLAGALMADFGDIEELVALLFPPAPSPEVEWGDFTG